ncbi:MAG: hypothetical protein JW944_00975 [Deltaproteobacteria bacterium]|nr:hypothetical protein [Deltaproteobacteria bacterium]
MTTEEFHRKLTAILSADAVGYSRLMGDDEAATVKILETYKGVMSSLIRQHRGRIVDSPGDNLLAEFGSVVDAVQCAVSIQKELQTRNADLPESRRMKFRIGINLGDVIEEEDRIYGDGVNIAARLEAIADPGGICISKTAFDYIENKLPFGYRFIGEQTVKNIAKPIGAYKVLMETRVVDEEKGQKARAPFWKRKSVLSLGIIVILAIAAVLYWNVYSRRPSIELASIEPKQVHAVSEVEETPKTIAILPFANLSSDPEQVYFVDGLSEEILNSLAQIQDLNVIGRTSSFSFKGSNKTVQEIASALGADHILEGSVRKAGDALRITAQLLRGTDGVHLWSKTYDRELKDIFEIQEDIATAVADELKATLGINKSIKKLGGTDNVEAYELYLVAKGQNINFKTHDSALVSIDSAIALDNRFALAWAEKAQTHLFLSIVVPSNRASEELDAAISAARRAIEIEPNLKEAYISLMGYNIMKCDWIEAEQAMQKTFQLTEEQSSDTKIGIARFYQEVGFFEREKKILEEIRRSDPLNEVARSMYVLNLAFLGDVKRAEEEYRRGRELFNNQWEDGDITITNIRLGVDHSISSDEIIYSDPTYDAVKEHLASPKDGLAELRRIYIDRKNLSSSDFIYISLWAAHFGGLEFAMDSMEKGLSSNAASFFWNWLPVMHDVRQTPRFKKFVKDIGLVDYWNKFGWPDICHQLDNGDFECD